MDRFTGEDSIQVSILKDAPIGICIVNADTFIVEFANDVYTGISGKPYEIICSSPIWNISPVTQPYFETALQNVITAGIPSSSNEIELVLVRQNIEQHLYVTFIYNPVKDKAGKVVSICVWVMENTNLVNDRRHTQSLNEELAVFNEELTASNEQLHLTNIKLVDSKNRLLKSNSRLTESEERFRDMAEQTDVLIAVSDRAMRTTYYNSSWQKLTGRTVADLIKDGWNDLLHKEEQENFLSSYTSAFDKWEPFKSEFRILNKRNDYTWLYFKSLPRFNTDGTFVGYISSAFDITDRKQDDQRKNDFISMVSHELKTPLTSISGYVEILQALAQKDEDAVAANILQKAFRQVSKMTVMINGFLNVSRLESGKILIEKTKFDMATLMQEIEQEAATTVFSHPIVFAPVEPTIVFADRDKIGHVINNLISNAVKYSPAGTTVQVACTTVDGLALVKVKDNGFGIEPEDTGKIFDRYYRANRNTNISGFGIGLYLSAEIIKRHDGKIWVESKPGEGSTFAFSLATIQG